MVDLECSGGPDEEREQDKVGEEALKGSMRICLIGSMEESWLHRFIM